jgi:hypothetical protein
MKVQNILEKGMELLEWRASMQSAETGDTPLHGIGFQSVCSMSYLCLCVGFLGLFSFGSRLREWPLFCRSFASYPRR